MTNQSDTALGDLLRELREQRGLSVKRLAKLSEVSRKTIDNAEKGQNISVLVLKKLLRPLGVEEITIRVAGDPTLRLARGLSEADRRAIAEDAERGAALLQAISRRIRSMNEPHDPVSDRAEGLISSLSSFVRSVDDVAELERLEQSLTTLRGADPERARTRVRRSRRIG